MQIEAREATCLGSPLNCPAPLFRLTQRLASLRKSYMQKITPFLWFDNQAEEAMNFYVSIFKNSKTGTITRYGEGMPGPNGSVMTASFQLAGQDFVALNGGPLFKFTEAISFVVNCETQKESG